MITSADDLASALKAVDDWARTWSTSGATADRLLPDLILTPRQVHALLAELAGTHREDIARRCFSGVGLVADEVPDAASASVIALRSQQAQFLCAVLDGHRSPRLLEQRYSDFVTNRDD